MKQSINKIFIIGILIFNPAFAGIEDIFEGKTSIENPVKLRDPFKAPKSEILKKKEDSTPKKSNGIYTNIESIGVVDLADIKVIGVLVGRERRAILSVKGKSKQYIIKEGEKLGRNQAEVRAIVPGGLILVEKVINIYGEAEYLETVIPISK